MTSQHFDAHYSEELGASSRLILDDTTSVTVDRAVRDEPPRLSHVAQAKARRRRPRGRLRACVMMTCARRRAVRRRLGPPAIPGSRRLLSRLRGKPLCGEVSAVELRDESSRGGLVQLGYARYACSGLPVVRRDRGAPQPAEWDFRVARLADRCHIHCGRLPMRPSAAVPPETREQKRPRVPLIAFKECRPIRAIGELRAKLCRIEDCGASLDIVGQKRAISRRYRARRARCGRAQARRACVERALTSRASAANRVSIASATALPMAIRGAAGDYFAALARRRAPVHLYSTTSSRFNSGWSDRAIDISA